MSTQYFINNLIFLGLKFAPKANPKSKKDFNKRQLAKYFEVTSINIIRWLDGTNVSSTNLQRIANKATLLLGFNITPDMLLNNNLKNYSQQFKYKKYSLLNQQNIISDNDNPAILDDILYYLKKYPEVQQSIYHFLTIYHSACK